MASAIALLLSLVLGRLFQSSLLWQARSLRKIHLQQQLAVAIRRLSAELQQSMPGGVASAPNQISIQKVVDITTDRPARVSWETALSLYFVTADGLQRRSWPPQPPDLGLTLSSSAPFRPDSAQLGLLCQPLQARRLGRNVVELSLSDPGRLPLRLTVTVAEKEDRYSTTRVLSLRNAE